MDKMIKRVLLVTALFLVTISPFSAAASLTGLQFGFPVLVQSGSTVAFSNDLFSGTDLETINIGFPGFSDMTGNTGIASGSLALGSMDAGSLFSGMGRLDSLFNMPGLM